MSSLRTFTLTCLCSCSFCYFSCFPAYGKDPTHPHLHHHRIAERLKKSTDKRSYHQKLYSKEDSNYQLREHVLSPVRNVLACPPFDKGFSISKFLYSIEHETNSQITVDCSILPQRFYPKKSVLTQTKEEQPVWQFYVSPSVSWQIYNSPTAGVGSIDFSYTLVRYWRNNAQNADNSLGIAGEINDYSTRANTLNNLTFSQTFPGNLLTISLGQYSLYSIDGTAYDNDQQSGFISYALSQNASATYSLGSVGAYVQFTPTPAINVQVGLQDAYDVLGSAFEIRNINKMKYNYYGYFSWSPQFRTGGGQYSALIYSTRSVPEQPEATKGWSLNFGQYLGEKLYVFGRWNGSTGNVVNLNRSYVLGLASPNPMNRNPQDLFGIACAINHVNTQVFNTQTTTPNTRTSVPATTTQKIRQHETVIEAFATLGFGPHISITPDFQLYIDPALRTNKRSVTVYGIRINFST
ncbi:carbohydrate porin [Chlamydia avium]|uniref:Porin n=1 Tax=Chlamydia avium 10DC88 TaxID=1229831 RepID=W8JFM3_9CHLA|nr:carbohydrate porin [Chlamydia avium]AHK63361.1 Porin AaxA [Chlamydia avium 10DC88]